MFVCSGHKVRHDSFVHRPELVERLVVMVKRRCLDDRRCRVAGRSQETMFDLLDQSDGACGNQVWSSRSKTNNIDAR
jgi:hypothetical protein